MDFEFLNTEFKDGVYHCSKMIYFPLKDVVKVIYQYFVKHNYDSVNFEDIYQELLKNFSVTQFNRKNLSILLKTNKKIDFSYVKNLYKTVNITEGHKNPLEFLYLLNNLDTNILLLLLKKIEPYDLIVILSANKYDDDTIDFHYNRTDDKIVIQCKTETVKASNEDINCLKTFLKYISKNSIVIQNINHEFLTELINNFVQDEKEDILNQQYISDFYKLYQLIHVDNLAARIDYIFDEDVSKILLENNINTIGELNLLPKSVILFLAKNYRFNTILQGMQNSLIVLLKNKIQGILYCLRKTTNKPSKEWQKYVKILTNRANGMVLEQAAAEFDLSRERARQIEDKYTKRFKIFVNHIGIFTSILRSFSKQRYLLSKEDLNNLFDEYDKLVGYLIKCSDLSDLKYNEVIDKFYFIENDYDWYEIINKYVEDMPSNFSVNNLDTYIGDLLNKLNNEKIDMIFDDCKTIILSNYKIQGTEYVKSIMTLRNCFANILRKYFPEPVNIYNDEFLKKINKKYTEIYGDDKNRNDRATISILQSVATLVDRGTYKYFEENPMPKELADKIYNYIKENGDGAYTTNTLFEVFKNELIKYGIDNKYFLQGTFKQIYADKLYIRRDLISIDPNITNIASQIYNYIKTCKKVVTINDLRERYPGVSNAIFASVFGMEGVLNYWNKNVHIDALDYDEDDEEYLYKLTTELVSDGEIHNVKDLYSYIKTDNPELLQRLYMDNHHCLFSFLNEIFSEKFTFKTPFIAQKNILIENQDARIRTYISQFDEIKISDITNYVKENQLHLYSIQELIDSLDDYILKDDKTIIKIKNTNINKYNVIDAEKILLKMLQNEDIIVGDNIHRFDIFSNEVEWNQWKLYSAINKFGEKVIAISSNNIFRNNKPIFIKKEINIDNYDDLKEYLRIKNGFSEEELFIYLKNKGLN